VSASSGLLPISLCLAGSKFYFDRALRFGLPAERVRMIHHGVDTELYNERGNRDRIRQLLSIRDGEFLVLCAARLSPRKGQYELVQAFSHVANELRSAKLLFAGNSNSGSTEYLGLVKSCVRKCGLEGRVLFEENFSYYDMPDLLPLRT
jgi:glycosyltransferase involved in cell wall biosynthesis